MAQRIAATIDRAGLASDSHPEISWREDDLLACGATAEVVLPSSPEGAFHVKSLRAPARMAVRMLDARGATAEVVGGRVVYPGGYARGDVVHQVRDSGTEDFVIVRESGTSSLDYELQLEQGIAGLRLGPGTLELLDPHGAPRLRVGTPYVVDDAGTRVVASLSVEGCAYDTSPVAPWGRPVTPPGAGACRVHVAWNDAGLRYPLIVDPEWTTTHNLLQDRDGHGTTLLANGLVLFSAGVSWVSNYPVSSTCSGTNLTTAELFDPATTTFAFTGSTKYSHAEHRSVTLTTGQAVIAGAEQGATYSSTEIYDPTAGSWNNLSATEGDRMHPALAPLPGGGAMLFGGVDSLNTDLKTTLIYTPGTGWAAGPSMAFARKDLDAVVLDDGSILIVAGTDEVGSAVPSSERYVPGVGWDAPVSLAYSAGASYRATARLGNGKFLLALPNGPLLGTGSQIYDPATKQWSPIASTSVYNTKAAAVGNGQVLVLGSSILDTTSTPTAQLYDAVSGWLSAPTPTIRRYPTDDSLTALATGDVLVAGGVPLGGCVSTKDAEVFKICPVFTVTPASLPAASVNVAYLQSLGSSSGATGTVTYAITSGSLPSGVTLASNGTLSGTPTVGGTFPITVKATDAAGCTGTTHYSFSVTCPAITLSPTTLPYGRGGSPYDQVISSTGGNGAVTYAVTSGALPPGISLASGGTLSGTPTAADNFSFTVTGTDTTSCTGSQAYTLPIYCPSFVFSPSSPLPDGTAGTPYAPVMISAGGALGAVTYTVGSGAGTPPPGMTMASDGTVSGTPTQSGTFDWIVSATDASLCMHSALFFLTIDPNPEAGAGGGGEPDAGAPDAGTGGGGDAAAPGNDAGSGAGNDAASGAGPDAAAGADSGIGSDAGLTGTGADAAAMQTEAGADAAMVGTGGDAAVGVDAGAAVDAAPVGVGEDSSAQADANVGPDSRGTGTAMMDAAGAPLGEGGSEGGAAVSENAGCSCRVSRQTGSSCPLSGVAAIVLLAARRRRAPAQRAQRAG